MSRAIGMTKQKPFFSIITVSLNSGLDLIKTVESVLKQTYKNFEIIIQDAKSTDQSLKGLPIDSRIHLYIEQDRGIYDGMNKAVSHVTGDYCLFLNCGDELYDSNTLQCLADQVQAFPCYDIYYGDIYKEGKRIRQLSKVTEFQLYRSTICHQALIYRADIFKTAPYDVSFRLCADYEHLVRMWFENRKFKKINAIVVKYQGGGLSEKSANRISIEEEYTAVRRFYFNKKVKLKYNLYQLFTLRLFYHKLFARK